MEHGTRRQIRRAWGLRIRCSLFLVPLVLALLWPGVAWADVLVDDIGKELVCQCGCTMVVTTCDCGTADVMRKEIKEAIDKGQTKEEILASYAERYGETVLAAPTKKGFNITAWVTPFAAIVGGAGVVYTALRAWVSRRGGALAEAGEALAEESPERLNEYEDRLQRELKEFDEE